VPLMRVERSNEADVVLFESMVICEYLEESQAGAKLYPLDALSRARQRGWIEFGTAALGDAWQFLNAKDRPTADAKRESFRKRVQQLEGALETGPYFGGADFGMVDAVFAPIFRYFDILEARVSQQIFEGLPGIAAWRTALAQRKSVVAAVAEDYAKRLMHHLRHHQALVAACISPRIPKSVPVS
ncbi:MAG: glutathione S-transferase family protein, partial [Ensifer adhaerens]